VQKRIIFPGMQIFGYRRYFVSKMPSLCDTHCNSWHKPKVHASTVTLPHICSSALLIQQPPKPVCSHLPILSSEVRLRKDTPKTVWQSRENCNFRFDSVLFPQNLLINQTTVSRAICSCNNEVCWREILMSCLPKQR
jgi:hypothetical protein